MNNETPMLTDVHNLLDSLGIKHLNEKLEVSFLLSDMPDGVDYKPLIKMISHSNFTPLKWLGPNEDNSQKIVGVKYSREGFFAYLKMSAMIAKGKIIHSTTAEENNGEDFKKLWEESEFSTQPHD